MDYRMAVIKYSQDTIVTLPPQVWCNLSTMLGQTCPLSGSTVSGPLRAVSHLAGYPTSANRSRMRKRAGRGILNPARLLSLAASTHHGI